MSAVLKADWWTFKFLRGEVAREEERERERERERRGLCVPGTLETQSTSDELKECRGKRSKKNICAV